MNLEEIEKLLDTGREQRIILYRDNGDDIDIRGIVEELISEVKRLQIKVDVLEIDIGRLREWYDDYKFQVKRLRDGIKKHMNNTNRDYNHLDEELYKLLESWET